MENLKSIKKYNIFKGLEENEITSMLRCFSLRTLNIKKDSNFIMKGDRISYLYIIDSGCAVDSILDEDGNSIMYNEYFDGDIIGLRAYQNGRKTFPYDVYAKTDLKIYQVDAFRFLNPCQNFCPRHTKVFMNVMSQLSKQGSRYMFRIKDMTKKTTKEKLMSYLSTQKLINKSNEFDIPYTHQELALYLGVERSALSKELSFLQKQGLISYKGKHYIIYYDNK